MHVVFFSGISIWSNKISLQNLGIQERKIACSEILEKFFMALEKKNRQQDNN